MGWMSVVLVGGMVLGGAGMVQAQVGGRWVGSLDTVHADGSVERGEAAMELRELGGRVEGGVGQTASRLSAVREGRVEDGGAVLEVPVRAGVTAEFRLRRHPEIDEGEAKFLMLWRLRDGQWQLTRVVSWDHVADAK